MNLTLDPEALALSWIYVKTWGEKAKHLEVLWQLWKFDFQTIRQALTSVYTPDPDESNQHIIELSQLIRGRFQTQTEFFTWSQKLYQEVCSGTVLVTRSWPRPGRGSIELSIIVNLVVGLASSMV